MGKNLFFEYLSSLLFPEYSPIYSKCRPFDCSRVKASWSLLHLVLFVFLILMLSCITGCIQNYKYSDAYIEAPSAQDKALKEPSPDGNMALKDNASIDPRMRLELDFTPKVSRTLFSLSGDLVLWGNTTLPYLMLNATLWEKGLRVEKARYMLIQVEPGKKYTFDISRNQRVTQGEYDCILEASGPFGSLFSEKRRALTIDEPVENVSDRNPDAEERSRRDVSENSKMGASEYLVQGQNGNVEENMVYRENSAAKSSEIASGISDSADRVEASMPVKNESLVSEDTADREVLLNYVSKNASTETDRMSKQNRAAIDKNKGDALVEGMFVGSSGSNKYHRPNCRFVDKIKNKIYFKSAEEARKNGKVPCKTCNPP
ncbi:Uncharacterised protein [uncultured archaeon]|nr:Uncharacterised protein [uncultured archaeon]